MLNNVVGFVVKTWIGRVLFGIATTVILNLSLLMIVAK